MPKRTLRELAELCGAALEGAAEGAGAIAIRGPAALHAARRDEISFLAHPRYREQLETTAAGAVVVGRDERVRRTDLVLLRCDDPNRAFSKVVELFAEPPRRPPAGVHPRACVHPEAAVDPAASVGPNCTVGSRATIEAGAVLHANVVVGDGVRVGARTELHPGVVLYAGVQVGADCILHGGAVVGADGFGFEPAAGGWAKVPQCGSVVVEDGVEIGANATIDRARFGATRIGRGAKIDNLVHVAHNVEVGERALLVAQVGIAGSSRIGAGAILAGQVGVVGHVSIGDGARIGAQSGVAEDVPGGVDYFGSPAQPRVEALRNVKRVERLAELFERVRGLEKEGQALAERLERLDPQGSGAGRTQGVGDEEEQR